MAGEETKVTIEVTPEELKERERAAKVRSENAAVEKFKKGDLGTPAVIAEEIVRHPKFAELREVAGFTPDTAPNIAAKVWATIQAEEKAKKEAADKAAADDAARRAGENTPRETQGAGGAGGENKPKPNQFDAFLKNEKVDPKIGGPLGRIIKGKQLNTVTT